MVSVLVALALPFAVSGCTSPLAAEVVKQIVVYSAMAVAKPVMEPIIKKICRGLGITEPDAAVNEAVAGGVLADWQRSHGDNATYSCGSQKREQCEAAARSEAEKLAQDHAERFQVIYLGCEKQVRDGGTGGLMQSIQEINECTANNGFAPEIDMIVRFASSK